VQIATGNADVNIAAAVSHRRHFDPAPVVFGNAGDGVLDAAPARATS
jgi:hypothetical protein